MKTLAHQDDLDELLRRLTNVRPDSTARWGRMSSHQMVCHLADAMYVATGQRTASPATGPLQRTMIKWAALYLPLRWPPDIPTRPEIDQLKGSGTKPADFAADVARVESLLRAFAAAQGTGCAEHPIFGPMSPKAWLRWGYLHTDHHLRQFGA